MKMVAGEGKKHEKLGSPEEGGTGGIAVRGEGGPVEAVGAQPKESWPKREQKETWPK